MKREVEYHEVTITFVVTKREVRRVLDGGKLSHLAQLLADAVAGDDTNGLDVEELKVIIDGKTI